MRVSLCPQDEETDTLTRCPILGAGWERLQAQVRRNAAIVATRSSVTSQDVFRDTTR